MEEVFKVTNLNARPYLEENLFKELRGSMKDLLKYIQDSGELENYWLAVEKENDKARKNARRVQRE